MASRTRLRSRSDYEYAILWENIRAEYFSNIGDQQRADQCKKYLKELEWRSTMLPSTDQHKTTAGDPFADVGWVPHDQAREFQ